MTDDRLRAAQERVLREIGYVQHRNYPSLWRDGTKEPVDAPYNKLDANFVFSVVIPWARERGWGGSIDWSPIEDDLNYSVGFYGTENKDGPRATTNEYHRDPMTALWLALGEALESEVKA